MSRRSAVIAVLTACVIAFSACERSASPTGAPASAGDPSARATVVRVIDGDTLVVRVGGAEERLRLIGIDTPESVKPNTAVQCFATEASARTKALLPVGTTVRLERDAELRDRYKRLLAYVYRQPDNLFVNLVLAREGFALPYTFTPNVAHADDFVAAATEARQAVRGLWGRCRDPASPIDPTKGAR